MWRFDPELIRIGDFRIVWYGVIFALGLMVAFYLWRWQMRRSGRTDQEAEAILVPGIIGVIGGSRLGHVLFYEPEKYLADPIEILRVWRGGLASHGATIGLILTLVYVARKLRMPTVQAFDHFAFAACSGATFVRLGNFANSEILGRITDVARVPWAVKFPLSAEDRSLALEQVPWRHPSQLYEALLGIAVFLILYFVDRKVGPRRPLGLMASLFFIFYFGGRFFVEFFKEDQSHYTAGSMLTTGQYLSIPFFVSGVILLVVSLRKRRPSPVGPPEAARA